MEAIILAGGLGTRMRPLTETRPKPLLPILNRPMIDYVVSLMPPEVDRVVLAVNYMADAIRQHLRGADLGVDVRVVEEEQPLGTGGAFRNALPQVSGDTFLGLNGDVISSLDLGALLDAHRGRGGIGTIALWPVEDPSRYGVVELASDNRILSFTEKPAPGTAPSDLINAGVYALRTDILDLVEPGVPTSIEREVFPRVIEQGLHGFRFSGFWVDAGTPSAYLEVHRELLLRLPEDGRVQGSVHPAAVVHHPCLVGPDARVSAGAEVGPFVTMGEGTAISDGARLRDCVLLPHSRVGPGARLEGCILGEGSEVAGDEALSGVVLADHRSPDE